MNKNLIEKIAPQLTELMIKKMETLTEEWRKPWIADLAHGLPRNLRGTPYRGGNTLMLLFLSEIAGYSTPLFMTFKQAKEEGLNILKGSGSFPVFFWKLYIRHKETRKKIELADYYRLPQEQRRQYDVLPVMRYYPVFNIDQTDMSEQQPERYASLTTPTGPKDYSDGLTCEPLDRMLAEQSWLCPILLKSGNRGVLFTDARPDRLPRKAAVSGGCGILHDTSPRSHAQHGTSGASEPFFWLLLRRCRLYPGGTGR